MNPLTDLSDSAESVEGVDARFQRFFEERYASTGDLHERILGDVFRSVPFTGQQASQTDLGEAVP